MSWRSLYLVLEKDVQQTLLKLRSTSFRSPSHTNLVRITSFLPFHWWSNYSAFVVVSHLLTIVIAIQCAVPWQSCLAGVEQSCAAHKATTHFLWMNRLLVYDVVLAFPSMESVSKTMDWWSRWMNIRHIQTAAIALPSISLAEKWSRKRSASELG